MTENFETTDWNMNEEIYDVLKYIRDTMDWTATEDIFHIKDIKNSGFNTQEHKALLIKMVIDAFVDSPNISEYFMAVFGLEPGFENTKNLTERRNMLIDKIAESKQGANAKKKTRNTADSYARNTIHEHESMARLADYIAKIEDLKIYSRDLYDYMRDVDGMSVASPPMPSYMISNQLMQKRYENPNYVTVQITKELMHRFISSGEALELSIMSFDEEIFLSTLDNLREKGAITGREYYGWKNVLSVFKYGTDALEADGEKIDTTEGFDYDWFVRFFDAVANISNEHMQQLWGKILAGEIKHRGAFSLRTMEIMRNMTALEAWTLKTYLKMSPIFVEFDKDGKIEKNHGRISFFVSDFTVEVFNMPQKIFDRRQPKGPVINIKKLYDYDAMDDAALLKHIQDWDLLEYAKEEFEVFLPDYRVAFVFGEYAMIIYQNPMNRLDGILNFKTYCYRQAAKEIYSIDRPEPNLVSITEAAHIIKQEFDQQKGAGLRVEVRKVVRFDEKSKAKNIEFGGEDLLETDFKFDLDTMLACEQLGVNPESIISIERNFR